MNEKFILDVILGMTIVIIPFLFMMILLVFFNKLSYNRKKKKQSSATSLKKENNEKKMELLLSYEDPVTRINNIIDSLINNAAQIYLVFNVGFNKDKYITEKDSEQLKAYIYGMIRKSMTPAIKETISIIYNIKTEEELKDILMIRIKLYLLDLLIKNRKPIE